MPYRCRIFKAGANIPLVEGVQGFYRKPEPPSSDEYKNTPVGFRHLVLYVSLPRQLVVQVHT